MASRKKSKKEGLGRALIKDRFNKNKHKKHVENNSMLHTTEVNDGYDWGRLNLQSVTAESSLQQFLSTAELAEKEFTAEKLNIKYVKSTPTEVTYTQAQLDFDEPLTVPRRPPWTPGISSEEQLIIERNAFLEWKKHLNELHEQFGDTITPYERNIELWKQLWRTLERSDIVLLLLDARNPLLFRCEDLEKYATENKCKILLLLNKADLVSEELRKAWAEYFDKEGTRVIFFSAAKPTKTNKLDDELIEETEENGSLSESESDSEEIVDTVQYTDSEKEQTEQDIELFKKRIDAIDSQVQENERRILEILNNLNKAFDEMHAENYPDNNSTESETDPNSNITENKPYCSCYEIFDREKLIAELLSYKNDIQLKNPPRLTVGMIGYPNVGKSSTVNVLMEVKKVSVSSMPGHTRHIQSLILSQDLELLDCPGLVLPARAVAPDLLLTSVLPIHQMRSHSEAMARLCELVAKPVMEQKYGLLLPKHEEEPNKLRYNEVLTSYAYNRGFMTAAGNADVSRAARLILAHAAEGVLKWEVPPPGYEPETQPVEVVCEESKRKPTARETRLVEGWNTKSQEIDRQFFASGANAAHVKGKPIVGIYSGGIRNLTEQDMISKPWKQAKKHANKNKKEKLRRTYVHLDQH